MDRPRCATCPYWELHGKDIEDGAEDDFESRCFKDPPSYVGEKYNDMESACWWSQPIVLASDGCGHHPNFPAYLASLKADGPEPTT